MLSLLIAAALSAVHSAPRRLPLHVQPLPPAWTATDATTTQPRARTLQAPPVRRRVRANAESSRLACLRELRRLRISFKTSKPKRGVFNPVLLTGKVAGLKLTSMWGKKPALMSCRFALTVYKIAPVFLQSGFNEILFSSFYSYRNVAGTGTLSRHAYGLAVDVYALKGPGGVVANVRKDWIKARGNAGRCVTGVKTKKARMLRRLVCALEKCRRLHLVLTPDSDYAHRDHLHISGLRRGERRHARNRFAGHLAGRRLPGNVRPRRRYRRRRRRLRRRRRSARSRSHAHARAHARARARARARPRPRPRPTPKIHR